ncbi:MAG: hypothetical protein JWO36_1766 [Myxococcales bacterium]|nr:hypothetical protein [Myxococcales bacterium]
MRHTRYLIPLTLLVGCQKASLSPEDRARLLQERHASIDHIATGCEPDDWADLIRIAAGTYHWDDTLASDGDPNPTIARQTRCWAMEDLDRAHVVLPPKFNGALEQRYTNRFDVPEIRGALLTMMADKDTGCVRGRRAYAPAEIASSIAATVLIPSLRPVSEAVTEYPDQAAQFLRLASEWHPGPHARQIDFMVADGTPEAFGRMLEVLAPDYRWEDGLPTTTSENAEIKEHVLNALLWLRQRVLQHATWRCTRALKTAVADGTLGAKIVERLDNPDPQIRSGLLSILEMQARPSSRSLLQYMAEHDPNQDVRDDAQRALHWIDQGGESETLEQVFAAHAAEQR